MRTLAAPSEGAVVCTRSPLVSPSSIATLPGVISAFSSISSRSITSTRSAWSRSLVVDRVALTSISSSISGRGSSSAVTRASAPAVTSTFVVNGRCLGEATVTSYEPGVTSAANSPFASVAPRLSPTTTSIFGSGFPSARTRTITLVAWEASDVDPESKAIEQEHKKTPTRSTVFPSVRFVIIGVSAPLAQLDRASGYEPGGRTFESCRAHHFI